MINFDDYANENNGIAFKTIHNKNWPYIPDHPYRILIILRKEYDLIAKNRGIK